MKNRELLVLLIIILLSVKDDFSGVYDLVCKLLVFRDVDGFISVDDLKVMDDFCSLYSDFDNIKEEINGIVERQLLLNDYFNEKDNIINFLLRMILVVFMI